MLFFHRTPASFCAQDGLPSQNNSYSVLFHDPLHSLWHMPYLLYIIHNAAVKTELLIYFSCHSSISQLFCNILRPGDYWAQSQKLFTSSAACPTAPLLYPSPHAMSMSVFSLPFFNFELCSQPL